MSKEHIGNHALCGVVARQLENHKYDGVVSSADKAALTAYMQEVIARYHMAIHAPEPAPLTMAERIERHD